MLPHPPRLGAFEKEDEMSTIPLFQGEESVEDLCLLIKSLHEEMSTVHRKVDVLLAIKTDNTEALREMVASGPALDVMPFEDEAAPVVTQSQYDEMSWADRLDRLAKAKCPQCDRRAYSKEVVEAEFGYRTMEDGKVIVQSWCRECRKLEQATSPRKKPTFWSKQCPIAKAHNSTVQTARKNIKSLKAKLETKLSPSERAAVEARLAAEQQVEKRHKGFYNARIIELGYVHPNKAKRAAAKAAK